MYIKIRNTANQLNIVIDLRAIVRDAASAAELLEPMKIIDDLIKATYEADDLLIDRVLPF